MAVISAVFAAPSWPVSTVAFACYAAAGIDYLQEYYTGYFYFSAPIITLLVIAVAVVHAPPARLGPS